MSLRREVSEDFMYIDTFINVHTYMYMYSYLAALEEQRVLLKASLHQLDLQQSQENWPDNPPDNPPGDRPDNQPDNQPENIKSGSDINVDKSIIRNHHESKTGDDGGSDVDYNKDNDISDGNVTDLDDATTGAGKSNLTANPTGAGKSASLTGTGDGKSSANLTGAGKSSSATGKVPGTGSGSDRAGRLARLQALEEEKLR
jgi:hypothetical protein